MNTDTLRQKYLNFFARKAHKAIASTSLVPHDDPTLLFTTAGMNQFKKEFLGHITTFRRATTCQRCLRTDDLDKVGTTAYHHTFFEMLGNFSFGDYFKEEAILWAWEFLTQELKLNPEALWVSVYQDDYEAFSLWKDKAGFPEPKIVKLGPKDNFWPANAIEDGPNGPCGPCSEIFFDYGKDIGCKEADCKPGCNCGRFVEIWNLVFTQFNRKDKGVLEPLPNKNIDTGMGLERMASVMQGVKNNFEIDIFRPLVKAISDYRLSPPQSPACRTGRGQPTAETIDHRLINAIADHVRAITFAIYDGVMPSNEQRGYVVRKLIRKAGFHGYALGIKEPFLYALVHLVAQAFRAPYPELKDKVDAIAGVIQAEEKNFISTLEEAPRILAREFKDRIETRTGHIAFKLHDTYGIPLEITKAWTKKQGFEINEEEFNQDLRQQQERSKKFSKLTEGVFVGEALDVGVKESKFVGYHTLITKDAKILKILKDGKLVASVNSGETCHLILDKTPFYAQSGGQAGDKGKIVKGRNIFSVRDTQKQGRVHLHTGALESGKLKAGDSVSAQVDIDFRKAVARAHTATHLLQAALREVLGEHIKQAGSLVEADRVRFDFIHFEKLTDEDLKKIESLVEKNILSNHEILLKETTLTQAKKDKAIALFEEKYDDKVRVVTIGNVSKELCGGTHLESSAQVGLFKIISESSIAKGVRRIEALTGALAWSSVRHAQEHLALIADLCKVPVEKISPFIEEKINRVSSLEKELARVKLEVYKYDTDKLIAQSENLNGITFICSRYEDVDIGLLRQIVDLLKSKLSSYALCLAASLGANAALVIALSDDLTKKGFDASKAVKEVAALIDGSGGGRAAMAQAGGSNPQGIDKALGKFKEIILNQLT